MADPWANAPGGITGPITRAVAVTPNDGADLTDVCRALYVGAAGNVVLNLPGDPGTNVTLTGLSAGVWHPIRATRVRATGTTATGILAGY